MGVQNGAIWQPVDGQTYADDVLQPQTKIGWENDGAGGGPYTVTHEWDTDSGFGSPISDVNTGITTPLEDSGVPPSNMGPAATTWFYRATIVDTNDSGQEIIGGASFNIEWYDPTDDDRFHYLLANVGVGHTPIDDPHEIQQIQNDATSGTFTLSWDGQGPTSSINFDDSAANVEAALEGLSNIQSVRVSKIHDDSALQAWTVEFYADTGSTANKPLITANDGGLTGGTSTITQLQDEGEWGTTLGGTKGPDGDAVLQDRVHYIEQNVGLGFDPTDDPIETQYVFNDATGGTFTLALNETDVTSSITGCTASSVFGGNTCDLSHDGSSSTKWWSSAASSSSWIRYDFGSGVTLHKLTTDHQNGDRPTTFDIEGSDNDSDWTPVSTGLSPGATIDTWGFAPTTWRYWRLNGTAGGNWWQLFEVTWHTADVATGAIDFDDDGTTIVTDLEASAAIDEVRVHSQTHPTLNGWLIEFLEPSQSYPLLVADDTGLTGETVGTTIIELQDGIDWGVSEGGTQGPDGNVIDFERPHYLLQNVGAGYRETDTPPAGWGVDEGGSPDGGDGWTGDFDRFHYLLENVTTTQPCPFIFAIEPNVGRVGDSFIIRGQGLVGASSPTADPWDAVVRIYETPSFAAAFVTATITSWTAGNTEDTITVEIPSGATNGHVAVLHTTTPTCTGSNFKFLSVIAQTPDLDAGWWIQAWTIDVSQRLIAALPVPSGSATFQKIKSDVGSGTVELPAFVPDAADPTLNLVDQICRTDDTTTKIETLLRVYMDGILRYAFFAHDRSEPYGEPGNERVSITGPGRESVVNWGTITSQDWPAGAVRSGDFIFGSGANAVRNGGGEDGGSPWFNGGAEDGLFDPWTATGGNVLTADGSVVRTGAFSIRAGVNTAIGDGAEQSLSVKPGQRVFLDAYIKTNGAVTDNIRFETYHLDDADAEVSLATDDTTLSAAWQPTAVEFTVPDGITQIFGAFRTTTTPAAAYDFFIDDADGAHSTDPWLTHEGAAIELDDINVTEGTYSFKVTPSTTIINSGINQIAPVQANTDYTYTVRLTGTVGKLVRLRAIFDETTVVSEITIVAGVNDLSVSGTAGNDQSGALIVVESRDATGADPFWVDDIRLTPGQPAGSGGTIVTDILDPIQSRGTLTFLQTNWTDTLDSNGEAWEDGTLAITIAHGQSFARLLDRLVTFGLEWEVTDNYELRIVNALGNDLTLLPDGVPVITSGKAVIGGDIGGENPRATRWFAEGAGGIWTSMSNPDWETTLDQRETYISNTTAPDATTLGKLIAAAEGDEDARGTRLKVTMTRGDNLRPFVDFDIGDTIYVDLPAQGVTKDKFRVVSITVRLAGEGTDVTYIVDLNRLEYEEAATLAAAVQRLLTKGLDDGALAPGAGVVGSSIGSGTGSGQTVTTDPQPLPIHDHVFLDITDRAASGDLSGTYPAPLVTQLRGRPIGVTAPNDGEALEWNATSGQWEPATHPPNPSHTEEFQFSKEGDIEVAISKFRIYTKDNRTIDFVKATLGDAPTGSSAIIDILIDGSTSLWTLQVDQPTIADAGNTTAWVVPDDGAWDAGEYIVVSVEQVGSSTPGSNLTVQVMTTETAAP